MNKINVPIMTIRQSYSIMNNKGDDDSNDNENAYDVVDVMLMMTVGALMIMRKIIFRMMTLINMCLWFSI